MTRREFARLMQRIGPVVAVAAVVVFTANAVTLGAHEPATHRGQDKEQKEKERGNVQKRIHAVPDTVDPQLECPCWNTYMPHQLLRLLNPNSTAVENYCIVNSSTVSLSQDLGVNTLVYAAGHSCIRRVNGVDVESHFALTEPEAAACISEAKALLPVIKWCR
jgi:hypothetical protein